jgi:hypothetical protein
MDQQERPESEGNHREECPAVLISQHVFARALHPLTSEEESIGT